MDDIYESEDFKLLTETSNDLFNNYTKKKTEKQYISMQLIIKRNLISPKSNPTLLLSSRCATPKEQTDADLKAIKSAKAEEQAEKLLKLTHIHLDRENIVEIDNLAEYLGPITNLYLQYNLIKKIENLEFLTSLKFLVLSNNQIETIENLKHLKQLKFLDLANNLIFEFDANELPTELMILDLRGNKCCTDEKCWKENNYEEKLREHLKNIEQLNGRQLNSNNEYERKINENNEIDEDLDERVNQDVTKMHKIGEEIIERSKLRQKEYELKSKKSFELMKLELERSKKDLLEKLKK